MPLPYARAVSVAGILIATATAAFAQAPPPPIVGRNFEVIDSAATLSIGGGLFEPPDTNGAVGLNHYVEFLNGSFTVFRKDGTQVKQLNVGAFFTAAGVGITSANLTDPR